MLLWAVLCVAVFSAAWAAPAAAQTVWELTPYRVQIRVQFTPALELAPQLRQDVVKGLGDRIDALVGAPWDVTVVDASEVDRAAPLAEPPPAPSGDLAKLVKQGRELFFSRQTGCARCHPPPMYTDAVEFAATADRPPRHDVGTDLPEEGGPRRLETPTLLGSGSLRVLLHHEKAKTLDEVFTEYNPQDRHGRTSQLTEDQVRALAGFVRSLQPPELDKVMLLGVSPSAEGHRVTAREFDVRTRLLGTPVRRPVRQLGKLRDVMLSTVLETFAPLGRIEQVKKKLRVRVLLAMAPDAKLTGQRRTDVLAHLAAEAQPVAKEKIWEVTAVAAPPEFRDALGSSAGPLSAGSFPQRSSDYDEVIALYVYPTQGSYAVITVGINPVVGELRVSDPVAVPQLDRLERVAWTALFEAMDKIKHPRPTWVRVRLKAGALPFRDDELAMVHRGDSFRPVIRRNDREGNVIGIRSVSWSFCMVQELAAGDLVCRLHTGVVGGLSGRRRGRLQQLALAVVPPQRPSVLVLQSPHKPPRPLAGYGVYAHPPDSKTGVLLGRTDRRGRITIPPVETGNPLRILQVRNGGQLLQRLPMVPGMAPEPTARIVNDDQRLQTEGFVTGLQEQMVDLVTRREVIFARARARIKAGQFDEAQALLDRARKLPTAHEFGLKLRGQQKDSSAVDRRVQARINKLFDDTHELVNQHLDPEAVEDLRRELQAARNQAGS